MNDLVVVETVMDRLQAEIVRGLLEARGVSVLLSAEAAALLEGVGFGPMAEIHLLVPADQAEQARRILADFKAGRLEQDS